MRNLKTRSTLIPAVAAATLLWAAGCAGTTDDNGDVTSERQSELLVSGVHVDGDGSSTTLLFGHTSDQRWTYELAGTNDGDTRSRRQAQNGQGQGQGGQGQGNGQGNGMGQPAVPSGVSPQFRAGSGASATFGDTATSGAHSRFVARSNGQPKFNPSSGGASRFDPSGVGAGGDRCDPTTVCDYLQAVCEVYPNYPALDCNGSSFDECRTNLRTNRASFRANLEQSVCYFSAVFECAARGVRSAGRVSTDRALVRAISRGLNSCPVDADLDTTFNFNASVATGDDRDDQ